MVRYLILLDDLDTLLSSSEDCTVRMWSLREQNCLNVFLGHTKSANALVLFREDIFITVSDDKTIKFWNTN